MSSKGMSEQKRLALLGPILGEYGIGLVGDQGSRRALRPKMGSIGSYDPGLASGFQEEEETEIQARRIRKYGADGKAFNEAITQWQQESSAIRAFFLSGEIPDFYSTQKPTEVFEALKAFWLVMTRQKGYEIDVLQKDTILYRGVRLPLTEASKPGYVMFNTLTNWSSSPFVSATFTAPECCMLQCKFPRGTKYYFTGYGNMREFEFIIPGGLFRALAPPAMARFENRYGTKRQIMLWQLKFEPVVQHPFYTKGQVWDQFFPWPSESPLKNTVATYWREYKRKIEQKEIPQTPAVEFVPVAMQISPPESPSLEISPISSPVQISSDTGPSAMEPTLQQMGEFFEGVRPKVDAAELEALFGAPTPTAAPPQAPAATVRSVGGPRLSPFAPPPPSSMASAAAVPVGMDVESFRGGANFRRRSGGANISRSRRLMIKLR